MRYGPYKEASSPGSVVAVTLSAFVEAAQFKHSHDERYPEIMCYLRNFFDICEQQTFTCDAFGKYSTGIVINSLANFADIAALNESCYDSERSKSVCQTMS
jgi:hypothetical protein